jgi:hypothetical protein
MKLSALVLLLSVLAAPAFAAPSSDQAVSVARGWLAVIDGGRYADSWTGASAFFQQGVSQAKWVGMVKSIRERLGLLASRKYEAVELTKTLPGVPDGDYAIVRFRAVFLNKIDTTETITLTLENEQWKPAGYFIR